MEGGRLLRIRGSLRAVRDTTGASKTQSCSVDRVDMLTSPGHDPQAYLQGDDARLAINHFRGTYHPLTPFPHQRLLAVLVLSLILVNTDREDLPPFLSGNGP